MDIYSRIKHDHQQQHGLSAGLDDRSGDSAKRKRLFDALIALSEGQETARHSISEHQDAAKLLDELSTVDMASSGWLNTFNKLNDELEHHMDEEEKEVFELAQDC